MNNREKILKNSEKKDKNINHYSIFLELDNSGIFFFGSLEQEKETL